MPIVKLFTVPSGQTDKIIGIADVINFWPKMAADGIPAWVQRPGLTKRVISNFPPTNGGGGSGGGPECTATSVIPFDHDYIVDNGQKIYGRDVYDNLHVWNFDNVAGTLHCPSIKAYTSAGGGDTNAPAYAIAVCINDFFVTPLPFPGEKRTVRFIYHTFETPYFYINDNRPRITNSAISKNAYLNIDTTDEYFNFGSYSEGVEFDGEIYIECVKVEQRDWQAAGENATDIYYPI